MPPISDPMCYDGKLGIRVNNVAKDGKRATAPGMSADEFRTALQSHLCNSGYVNAIAAQFRRKIIEELRSGPAYEAAATMTGGGDGLSLRDLAMRSLVVEYLRSEGLVHTLAVFGPESGMKERPLALADTLKVLGVDFVHKTGDDQTGRSSGLGKLVEAVSLLSEPPSRSNATSQTDAIEDKTNVNNSLQKIMQRCEDAIQEEREAAARAIEKRRLDLEGEKRAYQQECDEKARRELEEKMEEFRSAELGAIKRQQHAEFQAARSELKREYSELLQKSIDREELSKKSFARQQHDMEMECYNARQKLLQDSNEIKQREAEGEREMEMRSRKLALEEQRVSHLLKAAEEKLSLAEQKENELKKDLEAEYEKVRDAAKRVYDDATEAVIVQKDFLSREMTLLKEQRQDLEKEKARLHHLEHEVITVRAERTILSSELDEVKKKLRRMEKLAAAAAATTTAGYSGENGHEKNTFKSERHELVAKTRELKEVTEANKTNEKSRVDDMLQSLQQRMIRFEEETKRALSKAETASAERDSATAELEGLRGLLTKSQEALKAINANSTKPDANTPRTATETAQELKHERMIRLARAQRMGRHCMPCESPRTSSTKEHIQKSESEKDARCHPSKVQKSETMVARTDSPDLVPKSGNLNRNQISAEGGTSGHVLQSRVEVEHWDYPREIQEAQTKQKTLGVHQHQETRREETNHLEDPALGSYANYICNEAGDVTDVQRSSVNDGKEKQGLIGGDARNVDGTPTNQQGTNANSARPKMTAKTSKTSQKGAESRATSTYVVSFPACVDGDISEIEHDNSTLCGMSNCGFDKSPSGSNKDDAKVSEGSSRRNDDGRVRLNEINSGIGKCPEPELEPIDKANGTNRGGRVNFPEKVGSDVPITRQRSEPLSAKDRALRDFVSDLESSNGGGINDGPGGRVSNDSNADRETVGIASRKDETSKSSSFVSVSRCSGSLESVGATTTASGSNGRAKVVGRGATRSLSPEPSKSPAQPRTNESSESRRAESGVEDAIFGEGTKAIPAGSGVVRSESGSKSYDGGDTFASEGTSRRDEHKSDGGGDVDGGSGGGSDSEFGSSTFVTGSESSILRCSGSDVDRVADSAHVGSVDGKVRDEERNGPRKNDSSSPDIARPSRGDGSERKEAIKERECADDDGIRLENVSSERSRLSKDDEAVEESIAEEYGGSVRSDGSASDVVNYDDDDDDNDDGDDYDDNDDDNDDDDLRSESDGDAVEEDIDSSFVAIEKDPGKGGSAEEAIVAEFRAAGARAAERVRELKMKEKEREDQSVSTAPSGRSGAARSLSIRTGTSCSADTSRAASSEELEVYDEHDNDSYGEESDFESYGSDW